VNCVLQLIRREDTMLLGLVLLNIASEELACPRDDLVAARKHQLNVLMLHEVPAIFAALNGLSALSRLVCVGVAQVDTVINRPL